MSALHTAVDVFLMDRQSRGLSPATLDFYRRQLTPFVVWCTEQEIDELLSLDSDLLRRYQVHLQDRGLAPRSQHAAARSIRALLNFLVEEEWLDDSPMRKVKLPKVVENPPDVLTREEVETLLDACLNARDEAVILCLLDTGCRASEFVGLNWGDVDLSSGRISIKGGKGGKDRMVRLGTKSRKALSRYMMSHRQAGKDDPVWISLNDGQRLTRHGLDQICKRLRKRTGIERCYPHLFRHTFAVWSLRAGMNIYQLQGLMGHEDLSTLRKYLKLSELDFEEAHRKYGAVDNML